MIDLCVILGVQTLSCVTASTSMVRLQVVALRVCLLVACLMSQQQASVSQGRICSDNFTCCHTEMEVADQTFYLTQSQYTDTGPTSPSADPITPGAWQNSHWSANFEVTGLKRIGVKTSAQCPCGEADQTSEHYLQSCSLHQQARQQIWPTCVSLKTKLWGSAEDLFLTSRYAALTGERI